MAVKVFFLFVPLLLLGADAPVSHGNIGAGEGPAWDGKEWLYFTGGGRIRRWNSSGRVEVFRDHAGGANGLLFDRQGRLIVCEAANRRVVRLEPDGSTTILADRFEGKRFNSPNDVTIDSHGRLYFSDPRYGNRDGMELPEAVYRIDAPGRVFRITGPDIQRPNGVLVSPDGEFLYIADNNNDRGGARKLRKFRLRADGTLDPRSGRVLFDWGQGRGPDGLKSGPDGNLYVAGGRSKARPPHETTERPGGIYVLSPEGELLNVIQIPDDEVTNCAFGGPDRHTLFITAGGNLWSVPAGR